MAAVLPFSPPTNSFPATGDSRPPPDLFPAELWIQIVEEYLSRKEWVVLSKTCSFFLKISRPCLYKKVKLNSWFFPRLPFLGFDRSPTTPHPMSQFEDSVKKRPALGEFVRDLTLASPTDTLIPSSQSNLTKLDIFPNLEKLHMESFHIEADFCLALNSHLRLRAATFSHCKIDSSLSTTYFQHLTRGTLSEVHINVHFLFRSSVVADTWAPLIPTGVRSLEIYTEKDPVYIGSMLSSIMIQKRNHMLTTLSLGVSFPSSSRPTLFPTSLVSFLISSPQIRHLTISCWTDDSDCLSSLPADAIPFLEDYTGPPAFFDTLLRDRPVHRVGLLFEMSARLVPVDILLSLRLSSVSVTDLSLFTWQARVGEHILVRDCLLHAPITIRNLAWTLSGVDKKGVMACVPALTRLINLHSIRGLSDQELGREDIMQLHDACPSLREVCTNKHTWFMGKQQVWECFSVSEEVE